MICKKCNNEIEYTASVCPHCGEKCVESDEFFHEMLSHVMDENTQSSEELTKLKETMKKRKKHRRRNQLIASACVVAVLALGFGIFKLVSWYTEINAVHGKAVYRADYDGSTLTVLDEAGRAVRTVSAGAYTENTYGSENQKISAVTYNGFVSFEKTNFENNLPKTVYNFDGTGLYTYKDYTYTIADGELPQKVTYSSKAGEETGMHSFVYDEQGNMAAQYRYEFVGRKSHIIEYDSVGRKTGEQEYDDKGVLIYDKQYSYKPDGSLYLSSVKEPHIINTAGMIEGYIVKKCGEDGRFTVASIISPDNSIIGTVSYEYNGDQLSLVKYFNPSSVQTGWEMYEYYGNGKLKMYAKKDKGVQSEEWYKYTYHDSEEKKVASVLVTPGEDSADTISYTEYDENGREIKIVTSTENREKTYTEIGLVETESMFSAQDVLLKKTVYTYNADGNCTAQIDYGSDGSAIETRAYAYDGMGNVINQAGGEADHLYVNEYDDKLNLISVTTYRLSSYELYEYDENGNVIKQTTDKLSVGYERLSDGRVDVKYSYGADNKVLSSVKYEYGDDNSQSGLICYDSEGKVISRTGIEYDDKKKVITLTGKDKDGKVIYELEYNYSDDAPEITISGITTIGDKTDKYKYNYIFDENGRILKVESVKNGKKIAEFEYAHNEIGDPVKGVIRHLYPTKSETVYEYTYEGGHISSVLSKTADGQETKTEYALDESKRPYLKTGESK